MSYRFTLEAKDDLHAAVAPGILLLTTRSLAMQAALDRHIESSMDVRGGRPRIAGTRATVDDIVIMHRHLGLSLEQIAGKYQLSPAAVYAAMAYYYDHKAEIDRQIAADDAFVEAFKRDNPSHLREKLKVLGRG